MGMSAFVKLMKKIENAGTFSVSGKLDPVFPGLVIKNVGEISLPLPREQAEKIIQQCEQAPFGRGEETLVDTSVRNVWQLSPDALEFTNPQWEVAVAKACKEVAKQLGLSDCTVNFELYKVLVYAGGSFFQEHRDTEKIPNMFATLVINLPSVHEGGDLIVRHAGQSNHYSFAGASKFYPEFAAFYADCYHEVKPIRSGYRFSMIYNLAIAGRAQQPLLAQQEAVIGQVDACIQKWSQSNEENPLLAYLLDHSYSEQNLSLANLKNNDFAKASVLLKLAEKNGCKAFLCLVTYVEESYGDCSEGSYRRYRRGENISESSYEEYEVTRQEVYAHHFISMSGEKIAVEHLPLDEEELLAAIPLRNGPGREVSISEATGNEGAAKELWYHRAAVVMWPNHRDFDVVLKMDAAYALHCLQQLLRSHEALGSENRAKAVALAHHIVDDKGGQGLGGVVEDFIALGDLEVLRKYIRKEMKRGFAFADPKTIARVLDQFSWKAFETDLDTFFTGSENRFSALVSLVWLCKILLEQPSSHESRPMIAGWFRKVWKLAKVLPQYADRAKDGLGHLFQFLTLIGDPQLTDEVLASIGEYQQPGALAHVYAAVLLQALASYTEEMYHQSILRKIAEDFLKQARVCYAAPPRPPETWTRRGSLNCTCSFCREVNAFLPDPERRTLIFEKSLQRDLIHLQTEAEKGRLELDIGIERQPSKFKGVVVKNQKSYDQALECFTLVDQAKKTVESWMNSIVVPFV